MSPNIYVPQLAGRGARRRGWCAWALVAAAALLLLAAVVGAPLLAARTGGAASFVLYHSLAAVGHQRPERSLCLAGHPLAVCARCFGVYAGFAAAALAYPLLRPILRTYAPARVWLLAAALPTSVDFLLGYTGLWANTHLSRALTGAWLGAWAVFFVMPGFVDLAVRYAKGRGSDASPLPAAEARGASSLQTDLRPS